MLSFKASESEVSVSKIPSYLSVELVSCCFLFVALLKDPFQHSVYSLYSNPFKVFATSKGPWSKFIELWKQTAFAAGRVLSPSLYVYTYTYTVLYLDHKYLCHYVHAKINSCTSVHPCMRPCVHASKHPCMHVLGRYQFDESPSPFQSDNPSWTNDQNPCEFFLTKFLALKLAKKMCRDIFLSFKPNKNLVLFPSFYPHSDGWGWCFCGRSFTTNHCKEAGQDSHVEHEMNEFTRWWFQNVFISTPTWGNDPNWLILFKWVETTN